MQHWSRSCLILSAGRTPSRSAQSVCARKGRLHLVAGDSMSDISAAKSDAATNPPKSRGRLRWLFPAMRVAFLVAAAWLLWYVAGHWNRWTGAARLESTDDAFVTGDVTPLSARV